MPDGMGGPGASSEELVFKMADTAAELEQICAMNYATFVEEIPQHAKNDERRRKNADGTGGGGVRANGF